MILVAAQKITADTAANWGLFDEVVPADQLMDRAYALADGMRHANPSHVTMIKNAV